MARVYFAFISYQRKDEEWAKWLAHELEHYHLPVSLNGRKDIPKELRPIFRDIDELSAGNLPKQIHAALENSKNLIVICSPNSAKSKWVNKEIEEFIHLGRTNAIFPFIIGGVPMSTNPDEECFPMALKDLPKEEERLGGNINEKGRDAAVVKVVSGMLNLDFDSLWKRYEREKAEEERRVREQRDYLNKVRSRFLSEKVLSLISEGDSFLARLLALESLPHSIYKPDKPYVFEAEYSLRSAMSVDSAILRSHTFNVTAVSFSPDGKILFSASFDGSIKLWDTHNGFLIKTIQLNDVIVYALAVSPDGKHLAYSISPRYGYGNKNHYICVIDYTSGTKCCDINVHTAPIASLSFCENGMRLLSASEDGTIRLWDAFSGSEIKQFYGHNGFVRCAVFSPDNQHIVSASGDQTVRVWEVESGYCVKEINTGRFPDTTSIAFAPKGDYLVVSWDSYLFVLETQSWNLINKIDGNSGSIYDICFSHDGRVIAAASIDKTIRLWDIKTGECKHVYEGHSDRVNCVSFSPDDHFLASGSNDASVRLWEYTSFFYREEQPGIREPYNSPIRTKDGTKQLEVYGHRIVCVFDMKTNERIKQCEGHTDDVSGLCFSPDESLFASCSYDKTIRIWHSISGVCLHVLKGHEDVITGIRFNPTGTLLISNSCDRTVRIWDISTGQCLQVISNPYALFESDAFFTIDGSMVVIESKTESIACNCLTLEQLIKQTRAITKKRRFTEEEKARFYMD